MPETEAGVPNAITTRICKKINGKIREVVGATRDKEK